MDLKLIIKRLKDVPDKAAFARTSGVSRATLYRVMAGWKNPEYATLAAIEKQLDKMDRKALRDAEKLVHAEAKAP